MIAGPLEERGRRDAAGVRVEGVRGEAAERAVAPRVMGDEGVGEPDGGRFVVVFGEVVAMLRRVVSRYVRSFRMVFLAPRPSTATEETRKRL